MYWIRIRFKRACPPALIILKPSYCCRFGRQFKMYDRVIPTQLLDVTDIIRYDRTEYSRIQKCAPPWIRIRAVFTRWNYQFLKERKKRTVHSLKKIIKNYTKIIAREESFLLWRWIFVSQSSLFPIFDCVDPDPQSWGLQIQFEYGPRSTTDGYYWYLNIFAESRSGARIQTLLDSWSFKN